MNPVDGIFMSIAAALEPESKCFEEVRIEDYLKAYQATGRPPPPCPQEPSDETQRRILNLPPLFKPQTASLTGAPDSSTVGDGANPRILNPSELPRGQEFRVYSNAGEKYHCISSIQEFSNFSQEELRYYAYLLGNKQSPIPIAMDPFVQIVKEVIPPPSAPNEEKLQSIVAQPGYEKHSPEEFRTAYLLYRRELTSAELIQLQNPSAPIPIAVVAPPPATPVVASTPSIPLPIFASTTPSLPKFTFGFK